MHIDDSQTLKAVAVYILFFFFYIGGLPPEVLGV